MPPLSLVTYKLQGKQIRLGLCLVGPDAQAQTDIFLIIKLYPADMDPMVREGCVRRLEKLGIGGTSHSWIVMEELHANEMLRAIGVSNYSPRHLTALLKTCRVHPAVLQVEFHPRLAQRELRTICRHSGVCFQVYSSLGKGTLLPNHKLWLWRRGMAEVPPRCSCSGPLSRVWLCYPGLHGSRG
uniref:Zgc:110782 n=1 Tax=Oncorhynchus tshawytscha TaxID=74940 RepID=A0AAZ3PM23_ONCTS